MRTYVEVVGVGKRRQGIGRRSGVEYDLTDISILYDSPTVDGRMAETVAFDANIIGDRTIKPGDVLDVVMHQANFKTYVDAIL